MIFFITVLRALAACLITNAHYTGVYPSDIIANGGLLGDVVFFAVSGMCLVNIRESFGKWYGRRILRIYPAVWIITAVYLALGLYAFDGRTWFDFFIYPTNYHFVGSIILLYVLYYWVMAVKPLADHIPRIMAALLAVQVAVYIVFYDKSYYHIDTVREPMIWFVFFQSMLLGAYVRRNRDRYMDRNRWGWWALLAVAAAAYFGSKYAFTAMAALSAWQIVNQGMLFGLLYALIRCFAGIDGRLMALRPGVRRVIGFIADITLEIYLVQYVIIPPLAGLVFPVNWLVITGLIIGSAWLLHLLSGKAVRGLQGGAGRLALRLNGRAGT